MDCSISVNIMVYNEERCIKRCIDSIKKFVDEIIIVDTGSTDDTLNILRNLKLSNIKIYQKKWTYNFSDIRNFMIRHSSKKIIFQIDADEILSTDFHEVKRQIIRNLDESKVISVVIKDLFGNIISRKTPRIFMREKGFWYYGNVHEQLVNEKSFEILQSSIELLHDGYENQVMKDKNKSFRNLSLLKKIMEKDGKIIWHYYYIKDMIAFDCEIDDIYKEVSTFLLKYKNVDLENERNIYENIEVLKLYYDLFYMNNLEALVNYKDKFINKIDYLFILLKINNLNNEILLKKIISNLNDFEDKSDESLFSLDGTHLIQELFSLVIQMNNEQVKFLIGNSSQYAKNKMKEKLLSLIKLL